MFEPELDPEYESGQPEEPQHKPMYLFSMANSGGLLKHFS